MDRINTQLCSSNIQPFLNWLMNRSKAICKTLGWCSAMAKFNISVSNYYSNFVWRFHGWIIEISQYVKQFSICFTGYILLVIILISFSNIDFLCINERDKILMMKLWKEMIMIMRTIDFRNTTLRIQFC